MTTKNFLITCVAHFLVLWDSSVTEQWELWKVLEKRKGPTLERVNEAEVLQNKPWKAPMCVGRGDRGLHTGPQRKVNREDRREFTIPQDVFVCKQVRV